MTQAKIPSPSTRPELWDDRDIESFCREVQTKYGKHWDFIPTVFHDAIAAEMTVKVVTTTSLARDNTVSARDVVDLQRRIRERLFGTEG